MNRSGTSHQADQRLQRLGHFADPSPAEGGFFVGALIADGCPGTLVLCPGLAAHRDSPDGAAPAARARWRGRRTVKVVPACSEEVTSIVPPCAITTSRAMYKPSPMLPGRLCFCNSADAGDGPRTSGSKIVGRASRGMGGPPLWTTSWTSAPFVPSALTDKPTGPVPAPCCSAFPSRLEIT